MVLRVYLMRLGFSIAETACANFNLVRAAFSSAIWATKSSVDNSTISEFFMSINYNTGYLHQRTPRFVPHGGLPVTAAKPNAGSASSLCLYVVPTYHKLRLYGQLLCGKS